MIINSRQALICNNSFPKIFGGSFDHTWLEHIDVFEDRLAMVGKTNDLSLTRSTAGPFIALASITIPDQYYWAKVISLKSG